MSEKSSGCLSVLLPFLKSAPASHPVALKEEIFEEDTLPYKLRDDFLSPAEHSFYKVLTQVLDERFTVMAKVRLADIFFVPGGRSNKMYFSYFNKIAQRHVDFLILHSRTMRPLVGIELDDASHQRPDRQARDVFVDEAFQAAGLPLVRFHVRKGYSSQSIIARLSPHLPLREQPSPSPAARQPVPKEEFTADGVPLCPKCHVPMVLRTVRQGPHKGKQFYGCPNFPKCREVRPVPRSRKR